MHQVALLYNSLHKTLLFSINILFLTNIYIFSRLALQGMHKLCISQVELDENCGVSEEEVGAMRRYSVSDPFVTSLLRGVRLCL